jgi:hypothetical protein
MKRPIQHQIDSKACKLFANYFPDHWVIRTQDQDYGVDREVEIFNKEAGDSAVSTGKIFKAQIKGTTKVKHLKDGERISFKLEMDRADYLCNELNVPVFFFLINTSSKKAWWYAIQLDHEFRKRLRNAKGQHQNIITLHIPSLNILPNTVGSLLKSLQDIELSRSIDLITESPKKVLDSLSLDKIEEISQIVADKEFTEKVQIYWGKHYTERDYTKLQEVSNEALANPKSSLPIKFSALLCIEKIQEQYCDKDEGIITNKICEIRHHTALEFSKLIDKTSPKEWRIFSICLLKINLLHMRCINYFSLETLRKTHDENFKKSEMAVLSKGYLNIGLECYYRGVILVYNQCLRLISLLIKNNYRRGVPQLLIRIESAFQIAIYTLWIQGLTSTAKTLRDNLRENINMGIGIANRFKGWEDVWMLVVQSFALNDPTSIKQYYDNIEWGEEKLSKIKDEYYRNYYCEHFPQIYQRFKPSKKIDIGSDVPSKLEYDYYKVGAEAMGIDLSDRTDELSNLVNIGLRDLNPERVLKQCKHFFVYIGFLPLQAEMLGLITAGTKYLRCVKKDVCICGLSLDEMHGVFEQEHCSKCQCKELYPDNWKWSRTWQNQELEKDIHKEFNDNIPNLI